MIPATRKRSFILYSATKPVLVSTQPPTQRVPEAVFPRVKESGMKLTTNPIQGLVENEWSNSSLPLIWFHGLDRDCVTSRLLGTSHVTLLVSYRVM